MENSSTFIIEIATADYTTTKSAVEGGADRIELCAALTDGGTTPSAGTIRKCREAFTIEIFPIIRTRAGDFLYTDEEFEIMLHDIKVSKEFGCDGVVIGLLNRDGSIDLKRTGRLVELAYPMEVTFHRAFDRCLDPFKAMEQLIDIGCRRILTSGQQPTAPEGAQLIRELIEAAQERIIIMPGSGVRKDNVATLKESTGAVEFHSSLRGRTASTMEYRQPAFAHSEESYANPYIDAEEVHAMRAALSN